MREITQFAQYTVEIWRRPGQRNMHLTVRPEGHVRITCNRRRSKREIFAFIESSHAFIAKRLEALEQQRRLHPPRQVLSGETFLFFGERLPLQVVWIWLPRPRVAKTGDGLELKAPVGATHAERRQALEAFYRKEARAHLSLRLRSLSLEMGKAPQEISIRGQSTRWGSCSATGQISLNWKLLCAPRSVIDYVIVHELAHLHHMDHSPRFWSLVERFHPEWRDAKRWLRAHELEIRAMFSAPMKTPLKA